MTSSLALSKPERFRALSSLRFFAAILVVLAHFHYTFWPANIWGPFEDFSPMVSFFFMLSGFLLAHAYGPMDLAQSGRFIALRLARIWPMHLLMLGATWWLLPIIRDQTMHLKEGNQILWANIFLLQAWVPVQDYFFSFNVVTWYLSTLLACYLLFPLLIRNFAKTWRIKLLIGVALLLGAFLLSDGKPLYSPHVVSGQGWLYISVLSRLFEFIVGMCASLGYRWLKPQYPQSRKLGTGIEVLVFLLVIAAMASSPIVSKIFSPIPLCGPALNYYLSFAGATLLPFFLLLTVFAMERGLITRILSHPLPVLLGELSFGIYIIHVTLIHVWLYPVALKPHAPIPTPEKIALFFVILLLLSYISWRCVEKPLAALVSRLLPATKDSTVSK